MHPYDCTVLYDREGKRHQCVTDKKKYVALDFSSGGGTFDPSIYRDKLVWRYSEEGREVRGFLRKHPPSTLRRGLNAAC